MAARQPVGVAHGDMNALPAAGRTTKNAAAIAARIAPEVRAIPIIAENGGRHELRLEPSGKIKPILSRLFSGMVLDKRAVQIAIDLRNGRNPRERQVGASIYA